MGQPDSKTFLALTSLEEFWDSSGPMLFLGEWCREFKKKHIWEGLNATVLKSEKLLYANSYEAYQFAISVYKKLLPRLADWLNEIHGTKYSLKYWRLLVGPFLFWYSQVIFHRFLYLQAAYHEYPNLETYGLSDRTFLTPINTNEFQCLALYNDAWNLQLYTQLLDLEFKHPICYKEISWEEELKQRKANFSDVSYKTRTKFFIFLLRIINKIKRAQTVGILNGFCRGDMLTLMLRSRFRILPLLPTFPINRGQTLGRSVLSANMIDMKKRNQLLDIAAEDKLSKLVLSTLPYNMPLNFIEGFNEEVELSRKYFPYVSKVILQEQAPSYDQYKFWIGDQVEKGAKLISYQHGGCYGMQEASSAEFLECEVSDHFISWGWGPFRNVVPASLPHIYKNYSKYSRSEKNVIYSEILWISTLYVRYSISIHDWAITGEKYLDYQKKFFKGLNKEISSKICMRLNPSFNNFEEVRISLPGLKIYFPENRESFFPDIAQSNILIIDNPSTTFLYALAFNIPTILFWDRGHWILRDEAQPHLEALKRVGIYYDSPEGAAEMLNKIASDPHPWWYSEPVQSARQKFCDNFVRITPNYLEVWEALLLKFHNS